MEILQLAFDYQQLDTETRIIVQQRTNEIKALMKRTAQDIIEIGEKLIEVKERLGHGHFGAWLEGEFDWSWKTATRFMDVAEHFRFDNLSNLDFAPSALYLLAAPSTPDEARQEAIERAENGERITHSTAKEIVNNYKQEFDFDTIWSPAQDEYLDAALDDESKPVCQECGQVYDGPSCPDCHPQNGNKPHVAFNAGDSEWYTPQAYADSARAVMGRIDLDPASSEIANTIINAKIFYDSINDGLLKQWTGKIWMNPPYARELVYRFCDKLAEHYRAGDVQEAIVLVNNSTETKWFQRLASYSSALCLPEGRVQFWHPEKVATPLQGQAILYLGNNPDLFIAKFREFGIVWRQGH